MEEQFKEWVSELPITIEGLTVSDCHIFWQGDCPAEFRMYVDGFITLSGNILHQSVMTGQWMFISPAGKLLREVNTEEAERLSKVCTAVTLVTNVPWFQFNPHEKILVSEITDEEILSLLHSAEWEEDSQSNYQLTHYRCHYNSEKHSLSVEEVCVNEYGSCYGRGIYTTIQLPTNRKVEWVAGWTDITASSK